MTEKTKDAIYVSVILGLFLLYGLWAMQYQFFF